MEKEDAYYKINSLESEIMYLKSCDIPNYPHTDTKTYNDEEYIQEEHEIDLHQVLQLNNS